MTPDHVKKWMSSNLTALGNRPLSEICIPASHDSGTYRASFYSYLGNDSNVLTQTKSIYDQLVLGARSLDIRPFFYGDRWYCGHWNDCPVIGWQGGQCAPLVEVIDDVNRFTSENAELVILQITHIKEVISIPLLGQATIELPNAERKKHLLHLLGYNVERLYASDSSRKVQLDSLTLNEYIGDGKAKVIINIEGDGENPRTHTEDDLLKRSLYPSERLGSWLHSVTDMQGTFDAIASQVNPLRLFGIDLKSVLNMAHDKQNAEYLFTLNDLVVRPARLETDDFRNTDPLTLCLAANHARPKNGGVVIVYGGALITDPAVNQRMIDTILAGGQFYINNASLGSDPFPGRYKSCAVYYWNSETLRSRFGHEGETLHFEEEIISIHYGGKHITAQKAYNSVYRALLEGKGIVMDNATLGCEGEDDPQPGVRKTGRIDFRFLHGRDIKTVEFLEGEWKNIAMEGNPYVGGIGGPRMF